MIEFKRQTGIARAPVIKIAGLGAAGMRIVERATVDAGEGTSFCVLHTDAGDLAASPVKEQIILGTGSGAGGDPDAGYTAADRSAEEVRAAFEGVELVFLCAGLGGGTGSGGAPLVANFARQAGATVVALVTLPFDHEGKRREQQAALALEQMIGQAQLVLCFDNNKMADVAGATASAQQAFAISDTILSQVIHAIARMVSTGGVMRVGLDELATTLRRTDARCLFGHGESDSENRGHDAMERALRNPLMDRGAMLAEARDVIVHIAAGPDLTLHEISAVMAEFNRHIADTTRVHFGTSLDVRLGKRLAFTVIAATGSDPVVQVAPARRENVRVVQLPAASNPPPPHIFESDEQPEPYEEPAGAAAKADGKKEKAEQMQFEPVSRGRFEKSEPTILNGQDFDVPTFIRKGLRLK